MVLKAKSESLIKPLRNVDQYQTWQAPAIRSDGNNDFCQEKEDGEVESEELVSAQTIQNIKDNAYTEGFEKGRREGLSSAEIEIQNKTKVLDNLIIQLTEPVAACGQQTQQQLLELAFAVSRQIVRRELKQDPTQLIAIIRDALKLLPVASKNIQIFLHPDDASIVRDVLSIDKTSPDSAWQLVEEPSMERGGCLLETDNSKVDASVDRQIAVLFSSIAGGQRTGESDVTSSNSTATSKLTSPIENGPAKEVAQTQQKQPQPKQSKPDADG